MTRDDYVELREQFEEQKSRIMTVQEMGEAARQSGIKEILTRWGNWAREQPHTGYPKKSAGMGQNPADGKAEICSDDEGAIIDKAVLGLKLMGEEGDSLYALIFARYVLNNTQSAIAKYMNINEREVRRRLDKAEYALAFALLFAPTVLLA